MKLLIFFGLIALSAACRRVTTKPTSTSTAASTSTPPTTRTPTFANSCTGVNGNVLLTTLSATKPASSGNVVTTTATFTGTGTQKVTCYIITDNNLPPNDSKFTIVDGAEGSSTLTFNVDSASGQSIDAVIKIYGIA